MTAMISCILLSAGSSTRFGVPKALAKTVYGQTIIGLLQERLIHSKLDEIVVVLGDHAQEIKSHILNHKKVKVVHNKDYNLGQMSSIQCGLRAISLSSEGFIILPVDCPLVKHSTLDALTAYFIKKKQGILIPAYKGRRGHPPLFHSKFKEKLLKWDLGQGLNIFERSYESEIELFPVDDKGVILTFNTPKEFQALKNLF